VPPRAVTPATGSGLPGSSGTGSGARRRGQPSRR
jgi:hypothetical protein